MVSYRMPQVEGIHGRTFTLAPTALLANYEIRQTGYCAFPVADGIINLFFIYLFIHTNTNREYPT